MIATAPAALSGNTPGRCGTTNSVRLVAPGLCSEPSAVHHLGYEHGKDERRAG